MMNGDAMFNAFSDFGIDDIHAEAVVWSRMLQRRLASSVVAYRAVGLECEIIALKSSWGRRT